MTNIIGIGVSIGFVLLVLSLATLLEKMGKLSGEGSRKFIHIAVSNWWIIAMIFFDNGLLASVVPLLFIVVNYISYKKQVFKSMERGGGLEDLGTVYYAISLFILALWTFSIEKPYIGGLGILIMGYGDGLAAVFGKYFAKSHFKILGSEKSYLGCAVMFMASTAVSYGFVLYFGLQVPVGLPLGIALLATVVECLTPLGFDNLTVPLLTSYVFSLFVI